MVYCPSVSRGILYRTRSFGLFLLPLDRPLGLFLGGDLAAGDVDRPSRLVARVREMPKYTSRRIDQNNKEYKNNLR